MASLFGFVPFCAAPSREGIAIAALSAGLIGLYSMWWMWWGGFAWGPRFLVPLTPFWVLLLAPLAERAISVPAATSRRSFTDACSAWARSLARRILLVLTALLSLVVQVAAVSTNYVNYEIELRGIFPTDWEDPLAFGPPAQGIGDLLQSPVVGQFQLMLDSFVINTDLAWLWASGNVQWLVVLVGCAVLLTLTCCPGVLVARQRAPELAPTICPAGRCASWWSSCRWCSSPSGAAKCHAIPTTATRGDGYRAILDQICAEATANDAVVNIAPFSYQIPMNWMRTSLPARDPRLWLCQDQLRTSRGATGAGPLAAREGPHLVRDGRAAGQRPGQHHRALAGRLPPTRPMTIGMRTIGWSAMAPRNCSKRRAPSRSTCPCVAPGR